MVKFDGATTATEELLTLTALLDTIGTELLKAIEELLMGVTELFTVTDELLTAASELAGNSVPPQLAMLADLLGHRLAAG